MGPVIHRASFDKIKNTIDAANKDSSLELIAGGTYDDSKGYFVHPTVYKAKDINHELFDKEIFGPVLAVHVYKDSEWSSTLNKLDKSGGGFALTGAVFARDRGAVREAENALRFSAGNFYISEFSAPFLFFRTTSNHCRLQNYGCTYRPADLWREPFQWDKRQGR